MSLSVWRVRSPYAMCGVLPTRVLAIRKILAESATDAGAKLLWHKRFWLACTVPYITVTPPQTTNAEVGNEDRPRSPDGAGDGCMLENRRLDGRGCKAGRSAGRRGRA